MAAFIPLSQVLVFLSFILLSSSFLIYVDPGHEACFFENLKVGDKIGLAFEVGEGGRLDIDFSLKGPNNRILHETKREKSGTYTFVAEAPGKHIYCFDNKMSIRAGKTVTFQVNVVGSEQGTQEPGTSSQNPELDSEIQQLAAAVRSMKDNQQYLRVRERAHRDSTFSLFLFLLFVFCFFFSFSIFSMFIFLPNVFNYFSLRFLFIAFFFKSNS